MKARVCMSQPQPLLSIIGPTATGKTELVSRVAVAQVGSQLELISADSRQVYRGMEIATGVDIPVAWQNATTTPVTVHGVSMIAPTEPWSAGHFRDFAQEVLRHSWQRGHLPIIVGGTGLYHRALFSLDAAPADSALRAQFARMTLGELQTALQEKVPESWTNMNASDRANPRRLIRALERAAAAPQAPVNLDQNPNTSLPLPTHHLTIGLTADASWLAEKITARVLERIEHGVLREVERLIATYDDVVWRSPAFSATGYRELRYALEGGCTMEEAIAKWARRELQYAKRQLTWWRKYAPKETVWFDVTDPEALDHALHTVTAWIYTVRDVEKH